MNPKDKKVLNALQEDFPLVERPYQTIAREIGLPEAEVLRRTRDLMDRGVIRRFGILINHKKLEYFSTLLGVKAPAAKIAEYIALVTSRPEVTHCYERQGEYNLWFTFLTPQKATFEKFFRQLKKKVGARNVLNLPTVKSHKLKTTFSV